MAMKAFNCSHPTLCALSLLLFLSAVSASASFTRQQLRGWNFEDEARLGSTPPSCRNKCNQCRPCAAVQVPTGPALPHQSPAGSTWSRPLGSWDASSPLPVAVAGSNGYSDYKPLGWKCRCGGRFFDP